MVPGNGSLRKELLVKNESKCFIFIIGEIRDPVSTHSYSLRNEWNRTTNFSQNNGNQNPKFISLKKKRTSKTSLITRKINQIDSLISERESHTKILYLKGKLDETLKEAEAVYNEMKGLAENKNKEFDPGWIEEVIFSIDTCDSCVEEDMNSRKDDWNSSVSGNSVSSWMWQCEKEHFQFQRQEENKNLSDLVNKLNDLTIKGTELEPPKEKRDPEHQNKKPSPMFNEEDGINQSQIKEALIKFSN